MAERLKSLTDSILGEVDEARSRDSEAPPEALTMPAPSPLPVPTGLNLFADLIRGKSPKVKELIESEAWLCKIILHTGDTCNTLNGTVSNGSRIRTTCSKCKRKRENPKSYKQELEEKL